VRSNAEYGNSVLTTEDDPTGLTVNVMVGFCARKVWCCVSFNKYSLDVSFHTRPKALSNKAHVEFGSQICGIVESRVVCMGVESSDTLLFVVIL
jgi:hypothetical protein